MSGFKERLAEGQENWEAGKDKGFQNWPDQQYKFQLQDAKLQESQDGSKLMIHAEWYCMEGEMTGEVKHQFINTEGEWGPTFTAQFVESLGRDVPDKKEDLEELINTIAEAAPIVIAQLKTNAKDFQNQKIIRVIAHEGGEVPSGDATPASEPADEGGDAGGEDGESGEEPLEVRDRVSCSTDDGTKDEGAVYSITAIAKDGTVTIENDDGDAYDVALDTLVWVATPEGGGDGEGDDGEEDAAELKELQTFAESVDFPLEGADTVDAIAAKLKTQKWDRAGLVKEEIALLEGLGIKVVDMPKPSAKKPTGKKPAAKAPAKKKTKVKAKKPASKKKTKKKKGK